jgi:hypothetical protein
VNITARGAPPGYDRQRADIVRCDVPGYGYRTYKLEQGAAPLHPPAIAGTNDRERLSRWRHSTTAITVRDKRTERVLQGLNRSSMAATRREVQLRAAVGTVVRAPDAPKPRVTTMPGASTLWVEIPAAGRRGAASRNAAMADEHIV